MLFEHQGLVHPIDRVAREDQDIIGGILLDEVDVLVDRVRRPFVPIGATAPHVRRQDRQTTARAVEVPRRPVPDILVERERLILGQHADGVDAGIDTVRERKINDFVLPPKGDGGLRRLLGQLVEAAPLSACEQHCYAFFFYMVHNV